jgi:peptidoglycan/xylan/chitin deacetylase (PgdA/CDA1 family)
MQWIVAHGPRHADAVALTFDDGPGNVTPAVLDVLARHQARATFFVLGSRVRRGGALVRRAAAEGHELGVHAWHHRDLSGRPVRACAGLALSRAVVRAAGGPPAPRVFRPPYGATSRPLVVAARALGLVTVVWDVDPRDYEEPGAEAIRARVRAEIRPGSIVLLHDDRPGLAATAVALDGILDDLAARGLDTTTVGALLGLTPRQGAPRG